MEMPPLLSFEKGNAKTLRWECIWHVLEENGAPMWLKWNEQGGNKTIKVHM